MTQGQIFKRIKAIQDLTIESEKAAKKYNDNELMAMFTRSMYTEQINKIIAELLDCAK